MILGRNPSGLSSIKETTIFAMKTAMLIPMIAYGDARLTRALTLLLKNSARMPTSEANEKIKGIKK